MPEPVSSPGRRTTSKGDRPLVLNGRKRLITALSALALAATLGFVPGTAQAEPDIEDVQASVDRLYHEAEQASGAVQRRQAGAHRARARPRRRSRPTRLARTSGSRSSGSRSRSPSSASTRARGSPPSARSSSPTTPAPSWLSFHHVGVQRPPGRSSSPTTPARSRLSTSAQRRHRRNAPTRSPSSRSSSPTRRPRSTTSSPRPSRSSSRLEAEERERMLTSRSSTTRMPTVSVPASGRAGAAVQLRHGPGGRLLRLRRRRPGRVRLLRA